MSLPQIQLITYLEELFTYRL